MQQEKRLEFIKEQLKQTDHLATKEIADLLGVSFDTARRDVIKLCSTGQAMRVHGGIIELDQQSVPTFLARKQIQSPLKKKMAEMAKRFVHPGDLDFIGPSTTLQQLCYQLNGMDLEIVTNSIDNALALMNESLPLVTILGGQIGKKNRLVYSASALDELRYMYFNTAIIGASKVRTDGSYTAESQDSKLIRMATSRAKKVILIAEKYKFVNKNVSPFLSTPLDKIDVLITDTAPSPEVRQWFRPSTQIISVIKE